MLPSRRTTVTFITLALTVVLVACGSPSETAEPTKVQGERPGASANLDGTEWVLASLNGSSLIDGTNITLSFTEGVLSGFAGCNAYGGGRDSGKYVATDDGSLTIPQVAVTLQLCPTPEGVMKQEQRYLRVLERVTTYRIHGDQLWLETSDGRALVFTASEQRDCAGPNAHPVEEAELVWPELREAQPAQVAPGDEVEILGVGGHLYWDNECGEFWLESARDFQLFFDSEPAGFITCYANVCATKLTVPEDALPGSYTISVEGGSSLSIEISAQPTPSPAPTAGAPSSTPLSPPMPSPTPTSLPTPTPTPSPAPTNTLTPQPTATEEADVVPIIYYFRANVEEADPGETIVLEWDSSGGTAAILYHITPSGQLPQYGWEVAPSGGYTYQIPSGERNLSQF